MLGAWPRNTGAGTALIAQLRNDPQHCQHALVAFARSPKALALYERLGAHTNPDQPRLVAWY